MKTPKLVPLWSNNYKTPIELILISHKSPHDTYPKTPKSFKKDTLVIFSIRVNFVDVAFLASPAAYVRVRARVYIPS